jgi:hypothetical protein
MAEDSDSEVAGMTFRSFWIQPQGARHLLLLQELLVVPCRG